jgi:hypothetical protein
MALTPRHVAQGFAEHLNGVLNQTVSHGRLVVVAQSGDEEAFNIICRHGAIALNGTSLFLFVSQRIEVEVEKVHTALYSYRLQTDSHDRASWIMRWEFYRQRPSGNPYVLSHLHLNGELDQPAPTKSLPRLHVPTARVPLELVLWHLISEWDVAPITDEWQGVLQNSLEGFADRRSPGA